MQEEREFLSFHDRFIRDEKFRKNMIELGRSEEVPSFLAECPFLVRGTNN